MPLFAARTDYSPTERLSDAVIHVAGLVVVLAAVPVLITVAAFLRGDLTAVLAVSVYGAALVAMILCSALYNMIAHPGWSRFLKRLDHSAIYVKIAGTYTPFTLLSGHGFWLLAGLWGAALAGVGIKLVSPDRFRPLALGLYLAMGWAGLAAGGTFLATLSGPVMALILTGGVLYTVGVAFYLFERLPFHYTIWHVFVLAASLVFYAAVTLHLVQTA
ncbi:MAG: hemolysin III family protein [Rhodobacteraceae bacterium]|jgi:hemolysin III|uniref:PAQR family membrane homeostasis protein TrhA n=1 Tax=Albidovulum sp. TaxID=1872424 RepID=UPI001D2EA189|nr:hemolysin III family protein [uncultured Defluviimonas sp.]MCB2124574.1 hemolysin III family protein [Paracoccaceae bacterium]MCC0071368.1 hemolysin III family protein [Paracoccaceae bacterium]